MAKKLPKNYSVKTKIIEVGLVDMYIWRIFKDGVFREETFIKYPTPQKARAEGLKVLWRRIDQKTFDDD